MAKTCCIISIEKNVVRGVRLRPVSAADWKVQQVFVDMVKEGGSIADLLRECWEQLGGKDNYLVALTSNPPGAGCVELYVPKLNHKELGDALNFELQRYFPLTQEEIIWNYRLVSQEESNEIVRNRIRVFFILKSEWNLFLEQVDASGIKFDIFIYPFMAAGMEFSDFPICLPEMEVEFYLGRRDDSGLRHMKSEIDHGNVQKLWEMLEKKFSRSEDLPEFNEGFITCLLAGNYILSGDYVKNEKKSRMPVPQRFIPQRLRVLKAMTISSGAAALLGLALLAGTHWSQAYDRHEQVKMETSELTRKLDQEKILVKRNTLRSKTVAKVSAALPAQFDNIGILCYMAQNLPRNTWIHDYRLSGEKIYLTLKSSSEPGNTLSQLNKTQYFVVDNSRKTRNYDGSYYIFLILKENK